MVFEKTAGKYYEQQHHPDSNEGDNACRVPNECLCDSSVDHPLCNNDAILNPGRKYMLFDV